MDASGGSTDAQGASSASGSYTFPSVLHYLHREWIKFERERKWWLAEKAELQARIAFLEGQRLGEANLKRDLLRRIKMLEHALRTERCKNGTVGDAEGSSPFCSAADKQDDTNLGNVVKEGRQILLQYLSEMQYTDAVIEAQAQRVRGMLDSWSPLTAPGAGIAAPADLAQTRKQNDGFHTRNSLTLNVDDGGDDEDEEDDEKEEDQGQREESIDESDFDMGEYLEIEGAEPDIAAETDASQEFAVSNRVQAVPTVGDALEMDAIDPNADQDIPEEMPLGPRKSQTKAGPAPASADAGATDADDDDTTSGNSDIHLHNNILKHFGAAGGKMMRKQGRKSKSRGRASMAMFAAPKGEENLEAKLGELSDVSLSEEKSTPKVKESAKPAEERGDELPSKTWRTKMELKGHLDGVRNVVFHPHEPLMVSVGEDALVAVWHAPVKFGGKIVSSSEPLRLLRGHTGPVYAVTVAPTSGMLFTGGADGKLISWMLPDEGSARFPEHGGVMDGRVAVNTDHTDCIWTLDCHATRDVLFSGGVDGVARLWDTSGEVLALLHAIGNTDAGPIACGQFVRSDPNKLVVGHRYGKLVVYDAASGKELCALDDGADAASVGEATLFDVATHATMSLAATAYGDRSIKFFDVTAGTTVFTMVGHQAAVSSLDFDPTGLYLVSCGHDRSIRVWDVASKKCVHEVTTHRHKHDEAIHAVRFHPTLAHFASCGADAVVRVYA